MNKRSAPPHSPKLLKHSWQAGVYYAVRLLLVEYIVGRGGEQFNIRPLDGAAKNFITVNVTDFDQILYLIL